MLSIELGTEILKQGTNLKLSGAERITDMIIEKKQEEVKNDSTICKKVIIMNYICLWGILASITGIAIMFSVIKHKKSVSAIKNGTYLIFSILMICLGITTILFKRYDSICAISFGITFLNITYKDRRNNPPRFTISYIDYLKGYVVGFGSIMYGLFRIFE